MVGVAGLGALIAVVQLPVASGQLEVHGKLTATSASGLPQLPGSYPPGRLAVSVVGFRILLELIGKHAVHFGWARLGRSGGSAQSAAVSAVALFQSAGLRLSGSRQLGHGN